GNDLAQGGGGDAAADLAIGATEDLSSGGVADMRQEPDLVIPPPKLDGGPKPMNCGRSGNCKIAPQCGNGCCGAGESCDLTGMLPVCKCGKGPACINGNTCAS